MRNYWGLALTMSTLLHVSLFTEMPSFFKKEFKNKETETKTIKRIEMFPEKIEKILRKQIDSFNELKPLPYIENMMHKLLENNNFSVVKKPQILDKKMKEIVFSELSQDNLELQKSPAYTNYYRIIREKIRAGAYHNYNSNLTGEVVANFLVYNDGTLEYVNLETISKNSKILKEIAIKSIQESAPFPTFPPELRKYSYLKFNISIYFKNN